MARRRVQPESIVIIGDSRGWFDLDLDELEKGLGKRPVQLAMAGSCAYPVLADLADDETFHGTIICSFVPAFVFCPARHTPDGTRGKSRAPISHANAGATRQPISGDALGRTCRISQTGRPHARAASETPAHSESARCAGPAAPSALFSVPWIGNVAPA